MSNFIFVKIKYFFTVNGLLIVIGELESVLLQIYQNNIV
jgi:hypothetical protein